MCAVESAEAKATSKTSILVNGQPPLPLAVGGQRPGAGVAGRNEQKAVFDHALASAAPTTDFDCKAKLITIPSCRQHQSKAHYCSEQTEASLSLAVALPSPSRTQLDGFFLGPMECLHSTPAAEKQISDGDELEPG